MVNYFLVFVQLVKQLLTERCALETKRTHMLELRMALDENQN